MANTTITIRVDEQLKKQAETLFDDMGMNMTTAFTIFMRQAVRERGMPFSITARVDPFYSEVNQAKLREAIAQLEAGGGTEHELIEDPDV